MAYHQGIVQGMAELLPYGVEGISKGLSGREEPKLIQHPLEPLLKLVNTKKEGGGEERGDGQAG